MTNLYYHLGPWVRSSDPDMLGWTPPDGSVCALDLGTLPAMESNSGDSRPVGFFGTADQLPGDWALLGHGDCREIVATAAMQDAFRSLIRYRPAGDRLVDLLWDALTNGADPLGENGPKPLVPTHDSWLELCLFGHSRVRREKFKQGHKHWPRLRGLLRENVRQLCDHVRNGNMPLVAVQRYVGGLQIKYSLARGQWKQIVRKEDADLLGEPSKPTTTITETFTSTTTNLANSDNSWTVAAVNIWNGGPSGGECHHYSTATSNRFARCQVDLSSDDHYCQYTEKELSNGGAGQSQIGVAIRQSSGTIYDTYNMLHASAAGSWVVAFRKWVSNSETNLKTYDASSSLHTFKIQFDGSTYNLWRDGVDKGGGTDTSYTAQVRCGAYGFRENGGLDSWSAEDLPTGHPAVKRFGGIPGMALNRGVW